MMDLSEAPLHSAISDLAAWDPQGVATRVDLEVFVSTAMGSPLPPWRPIPSRAAARLLGIGLQSLANWRMRDLGPKPEPMVKGRGNRVYYRPDLIAEWLSGGCFSDWEFSGLWLQEKGMIASEEIIEDLVRKRIEWIEGLNMFPAVHRLWRNFRETEGFR